MERIRKGNDTMIRINGGKDEKLRS
jgi:hypothetical protein